MLVFLKDIYHRFYVEVGKLKVLTFSNNLSFGSNKIKRIRVFICFYLVKY